MRLLAVRLCWWGGRWEIYILGEIDTWADCWGVREGGESVSFRRQ